ncbi:MAG: hypothetical protein JO227_10130 [Acetobacteraceae bacterium]|nr:hypothetical protein [Acetobacteraceae bacterium]
MSATFARKSATARTLPVPVRTRPPRVMPAPHPHGLAPGELVKLHHSLAESLSAETGVICQFIAPESGAGTEHVVYDLAYISAAWLGKRVLFVNGTGMQFDPMDQFAPRRDDPLLGHEDGLEDAESQITRVVGLNLYQMTMPSLRGALDFAPTLKHIPEFLARLRNAFDLVVIAAPAASDAPMGVLLSRFVDGNVLVLEAGRTRVPVAMELRNSLSASGGTVVGAVLTRYRNAAPRWLRRWL